MSAKQSGQVWELDLSHKEAWVLMALADHADHEGNNVFPGQGLIAWKTGYSERNVRRILESLEKKKIIIPVSGGRGRGVNQEYKLALENAKRKPPYSRKKRTKCPVKRIGKSGQNVRLNESAKAEKISGYGDEKSGQDVRLRELEKADKTSSFGSQENDAKSGQNETQKADNLNTSHDKERARINRHDNRHIFPKPPALEPPPASNSEEQSSSENPTESDRRESDLSQIALALCEAVGWLPDRLTPARQENVDKAEEEISRHSSATPERVALAGLYYPAHNKHSFMPTYIASDWPQIERWLRHQERKAIKANGTDQPATRKNHESERPSARTARRVFTLVREAFEETGGDSDSD